MNKYLARKTIQFVAVFILNILFINLSLKAILIDGPAALWPASGVGIGFMLFFPKKDWPQISAAIFLSPVILDYLNGLPLLISFMYGIAITAEALLASFLMRAYFKKERIDFTSLKQIVGFFLIAVVASNALTAGLGVFANYLQGRENFFEIWYTWAIADGTGMLLVTPIFVILLNKYPLNIRLGKDMVEALIMGIIFSFICLGIFNNNAEIQRYGVVFPLITVSFLLYASTRFGMTGALIFNVIIYTISIFYTVQGIGPFSSIDVSTNQQGLILQTYLNLGIMISFLLAALICEREVAYTKLSYAQEELVRKERLALLGELSGGIAHELRNPLTSITNAVYYLNMISPDTDQKIKEHLDIVSIETQRAENIISALLNFSRMGAVEKETVPVSKLVEETLEILPPPKDVELKKKLSSSLPDIDVDSNMIVQVLSNLIENAYQAMPEGGKLTVQTKKTDNQIHISITDTGVGIAKEDLKKIFEPLVSTKVTGIGLGLSISQKMAEANGGRIQVESEEGKGSTFTLIFQ